jgi:CubicO group peptidase (beta-lactamase class C family)
MLRAGRMHGGAHGATVGDGCKLNPDPDRGGSVGRFGTSAAAGKAESWCGGDRSGGAAGRARCVRRRRGRHQRSRHAQLLRLWRGGARQRAPADADDRVRDRLHHQVFTTTLLALYAQRQTIKLDAPLQNYVPQGVTVPSFNGKQITLVDLATHTSGLPRQPPMRGESYSPEEMFAFLSSYRLQRAPRTQFLYSNLGVALLAQALAQATGTPWEQLVRQDITAKPGMPDAGLKLDDEECTRLATGYNRAGLPARENMPTWPAFNGAGALFSTVSDMQRFLAWNMGETKGALPDGLLDDLHKSRFALPRPGAGVGLAWQIMPLGGGLSVVWKNGQTLGYNSYIGFAPRTRTGVVLLTNSQGCPATRPGHQILATLNGKSGEPNVPSEDEGN